MKKLNILITLLFFGIISYSQEHRGYFEIDPRMNNEPRGFIWTEKRHLAINQNEITVDDYLTFLENVSRDSSEEFLNTIIPSSECTLFPYINLENGFNNPQTDNPNEISWINEAKFMSDNNYPPTEKIKGLDNRLLNPYVKPITGISYEQANIYAKWCTENFNKKMRESVENPIKIVLFRLPTPEEFENLETKGFGIYQANDPEQFKKNIESWKNCKNEKGCALCNCAGKDSCETNLLAQKYFGSELYPVLYYYPNYMGIINMQGNAAEMTSEKEIAKGGSYLQTAKECLPDAIQKYEKPEKWLGFRLIAEVIDGFTKLPLISTLATEDADNHSYSFIPADDGDYLLLKHAHYNKGVIVYKNSRNIASNNFSNNQQELIEEKDEKEIATIFKNFDKLGIENMLSFNENNVPDDSNFNPYTILEYKKGMKIYRICWHTHSEWDITQNDDGSTTRGAIWNTDMQWIINNDIEKLNEFVSSLDFLY